MNFTKCKIGQKVTCILKGYGQIIDIVDVSNVNENFPVKVRFDHGEVCSYTEEGRLFLDHNPTLLLGYKKITIENASPLDLKDGDTYFSVSINGPMEFTWVGNTYNQHHKEMGEIFFTENECNEYITRRKAMTRVINKLRKLERGWEPDWSDQDKEKYYCYYDWQNKKLIAAPCSYAQLVPKELISTKTAWERVIKSMKRDVKLMMGVK